MIREISRFFKPSLVRRLVVAQVATASVLWLVLAALAAWQIDKETKAAESELMRSAARVVLPLASVLHDQPAALKSLLEKLDQYQRTTIQPTTDSTSGRNVGFPEIYLWLERELVYGSANKIQFASVTPSDSVITLARGEESWHSFSQESSDKRFRFTVLAPANAKTLGLSPWSKSWVFAPLLLSLPLLLIPAWLSIRIAIRPLENLSSEISHRNADNLEPILFKARHSELNSLTQALDWLFIRLREARERERSFIADAAHELRTPIAAMRVYIETLIVRNQKYEDRELLEGLIASNRRAGRMVSQLLSLARAEQKKIDCTAVLNDLELIAQNVLAQLAPLAMERGVEFDLKSVQGLKVYADAESLEVYLDNIIGNAIKYSPVGGVIIVRLEIEQGHVGVWVTDQGPGLATEQIERVLARFYRVPNQESAGSGLGLSIAKTIAAQHGAALILSANPSGKGLQVYTRFRAANH
jgi:signal transduction histidine kinase